MRACTPIHVLGEISCMNVHACLLHAWCSLVHQLCSHLVCYSNNSGCKCSKRREGFGFQWFFFSFLIWVHTKWLGTTVCHNHVSFLLYQPTCTSSILICIIWVLIFNTVSGPASEFANVSAASPHRWVQNSYLNLPCMQLETMMYAVNMSSSRTW